MKKSLLCLLLCISLLLPTLVACGGTEPPAGEGGDQRPATPTDSPAALLAQKSAVIPCETDLELEDGGLLASSCVFDGYLYYAILANGGNIQLIRHDLQASAPDVESAELELGTAVSMCYNTDLGLLAVAHGDKTVSLVDPATLTVTATHTAADAVECLTYLASEGCYAARVAGKRQLVLLDEEFAQIRIRSLPSELTEYSIVDICADEDYVYFLTNDVKAEGSAKQAGILVYELATAAAQRYVLTLTLGKRTLTSLAFNGSQFLIGANGLIAGDVFFGTHPVAKGEDTEVYEAMVRLLKRKTNSDGISSELLFKVYEIANLGANNVMQGGCTDGRYGYFCMEDQANNYEETSLHRTRIVKVDMETCELVTVSDRLPLHHSNDMCYNSRTGQLFVVHCGKGEDSKTLSILDPETLTITGTATLPVGFYCMAYDEVNDCYMVGSGGRNFAILDSEFNVLVQKVNVGAADYCKEENLITQGSDCDSKYVYVVLGGNNGSGPWVNYLVVYDWSGNLVMAKIIPNMTDESENIFHIGDTIYVACNGGNEPVYKIELEK